VCTEEGSVKKTEEIMEILAAYDLTGSFRDAAALVGCDHHTVAHYVLARDSGQLPTSTHQLFDPFRDKTEEWVDATAALGPTLRNASWSRWAMRARSAPHDARWPKPRRRIGLATGVGFSRGCLGCGFRRVSGAQGPV
jgi:hypothetical protein